jgi:hypothetical protein
MINVSDNFNEAYIPYKALLIYNCVKGDDNKSSSGSSPVYVESYDIAGNGNPINAHPLSIAESIAIAELLQSSSEMQNTYLKSKGLLSQNLLFVNPDISGYAVWYTLPQQYRPQYPPRRFYGAMGKILFRKLFQPPDRQHHPHQRKYRATMAKSNHQGKQISR